MFVSHMNIFPNAPALSAAVKVVSAYLQNSKCSEKQIIPLLNEIHQFALRALAIEAANQVPQSKNTNEKDRAALIKDSITDEYLICLEDGQKVKSLKRYLRSRYGMTLLEYRRKWSLPPDYPAVAPALSRKRSIIAKQFKPHTARQTNRATQ